MAEDSDKKETEEIRNPDDAETAARGEPIPDGPLAKFAIALVIVLSALGVIAFIIFVMLSTKAELRSNGLQLHLVIQRMELLCEPHDQRSQSSQPCRWISIRQDGWRNAATNLLRNASEA